MRLITILIIPFLVSFSSLHPSHRASKKYQVDYCDLVGYTCIDCSSIEKKGENEDDEPYVKLEDGKVFKFDSGEDSFDEGNEATVFTMKFQYQGKELTSYKLIIEDEIYDVTRSR